MRRMLAVTFAVLATGVQLSGCGLKPASSKGTVRLTVTRDFGARMLAPIRTEAGSRGATVQTVLARAFPSVAATGTGTRAVYINGIRASAQDAVHPGDRIWWDLGHKHAPTTAGAVVGSFPEPFVHGIAGKRLPVTLECAPDMGAACKRVAAQITSAGAPVAPQLLGTGSGQDSISVVVGTWAELRGDLAARLIDGGPAVSGVYARFADGGRLLSLLAFDGRVIRTLSTGGGLVAATRGTAHAPTWLITGTDVAGVNAAASAVSGPRLRDHLALAVGRDGDVALPLQLRTPNR